MGETGSCLRKLLCLTRTWRVPFFSFCGDMCPSVVTSSSISPSFHLSVPSSLRHLHLSSQGPEGVRRQEKRAVVSEESVLYPILSLYLSSSLSPMYPHSYTFWLKYYLCHTFKITHMLIPTRTVSRHMAKHWFNCLFSQAHMSTHVRIYTQTHTHVVRLPVGVNLGGASVLCPIFLLPLWTVVSPLQRKGLERKWDLLRDLMFFFRLQFVPVKHTR